MWGVGGGFGGAGSRCHSCKSGQRVGRIVLGRFYSISSFILTVRSLGSHFTRIWSRLFERAANIWEIRLPHRKRTWWRKIPHSTLLAEIRTFVRRH